MNVAQIREAARLIADADARDFATLLELGSHGCQLRLGNHVSSLAVQGAWLIGKDGVSREVLS